MAGVRQHGWIVMHGSVRHPVGQRFHSDDTVAGVRSIFPLTRGQVIRGRDTTLYRAGRRQ